MSFEDAESVVVTRGRRVLGFSAPDSTLLLLDWDLDSQQPVETAFRQVKLSWPVESVAS